MDAVERVHDNFVKALGGRMPGEPGAGSAIRERLSESGLGAEGLERVFRAQCMSRHLDRMSSQFRAKGESYYTIGSSGHEGMAAVALAFRPTDMAFLHYRDAAFQIARASQANHKNMLRDMALSFVASSEDPISGGRHKVLGSAPLNIPPQTSTIASHLPKAVGAAFSIPLSRQIKPHGARLEEDGIIICSFGDASLNHSTAQGALNAASWMAWQSMPLPIVFICEDNGIGISTKTPKGWVKASAASRPGIQYIEASGLDAIDAHSKAREAERIARSLRRPVLLHVTCVRLYGHAGADHQLAYMSQEEIDEAEKSDPLLQTARLMIDSGHCGAEDALAMYTEIEEETFACAKKAARRPKLQTSQQVMKSLIPPKQDAPIPNGPDPETRAKTLGDSDMRSLESPQHMAKLINLALADLMMQYPEIVLAGEDIGRKGGVYGVTQRLRQRFGPGRVIDTLLDEQSILGLSLGLAHNGFIPVPEIQFLAYFHNAEDQIRGEAATLPFFSNGQFTNPMVVRIPGLGYQKGFGGHFHNDNSLAVLRDIPGLLLACPSNGLDAARILREAIRLAREERRVTVIIEPIALYMTRDLHSDGDGLWTFPYPDPSSAESSAPDAQTAKATGPKGAKAAIISYGNGHYLSCKAARRLLDEHGLETRLIDLRWLDPLDMDSVLEGIGGCDRVLVVDECRRAGNVGESLVSMLAGKTEARLGLLTAENSFIATGPAHAATLPSVESIIESMLAL